MACQKACAGRVSRASVGAASRGVSVANKSTGCSGSKGAARRSGGPHCVVLVGLTECHKVITLRLNGNPVLWRVCCAGVCRLQALGLLLPWLEAVRTWP